MQPEVWSKVVDALEEAKALPPEARQLFLQQLRNEDQEVWKEVESLLEGNSRDDSFLELPALAAAEEKLRRDAEEAWLGRSLGPYRLSEVVGRGGTSTVFRAQREDDEFQQVVAIKLIQRGLVGTTFEARFRRERQILAGLDHPNIARLLDGGTTEEGLVPYLVMELVEGSRITDYCARQGTSLKDRLSMFQTVCGAVEYAHRHLIVHRDLKPDNILVQADGTPKLLDFGIAKLLSRHEAPGQVTETAARALTPSYASPEQILGGAMTTASDVFSLGILLYELLTGQRPFDWRHKTPTEVERVMAAERLPPPSAQAAGHRTLQRTTQENAIALYRPQQLRGDLDNIVLKALRFAPEQRYGSAQELSEDIRRHLEGLPVMARPATFSYRFSKAVRRNPLVFGLATALFLAVTTFTGTVTLQAKKLAQQRDVAEDQRAAAEEMTEFLEGIFELTDPTQGTGETVQARALLDRQTERVLSELEQRPEHQARLLNRLGLIYQKLGIYDQAEELVSQALASRRELLGGDHLDTIESLKDLAIILFIRGDYETSLTMLDQALTTERSQLSGDHLRIALTLQRIGHNHRALGDFALAEEFLLESLAIRRRVLGPHHPSVADSLRFLSDAASANGHQEEAESYSREALEVSQAASGPESLATAQALMGLAKVLSSRHDLGQAEQLFRQALPIFRKHLGAQHPNTMISLHNLAMLLQRTGDYDEAEALMIEIIRSSREVYGEQHYKVALAIRTLADILRKKGELDSAEVLYRQVLEIYRSVFGEEHPRATSALEQLALLLHSRGDPQAETLCRRALAKHRKLLDSPHPAIVTTLSNLGGILADRGKTEEAEEVLRQALGEGPESLGEEHPATMYVKTSLAATFFAQGRHEQAVSLYREALLAFREQYGPVNPATSTLLLLLTDALLAMGDATAADETLRQAQDMLAQLPAADPLDHVEVRSLQGAIQAAGGSSEGAEALLQEAYDHFATTLGPRSPRALTASKRLLRAYDSWGDSEAAADHRKVAGKK